MLEVIVLTYFILGFTNGYLSAEQFVKHAYEKGDSFILMLLAWFYCCVLSWPKDVILQLVDWWKSR